MGGGPPESSAEAREKLEAAWRRRGREGEPRAAVARPTSRLGDDPEADATPTLGDYYAFLGEYADQIAAGAAKGEDRSSERMQGFEEAGCDELIFFPASADPAQVDLLAAAAL